MTAALRREKQAELNRVRRALEAIEAGTDGVCQRCEEDISAAQLRARPDALLCISCAQRATTR